MKKVWLGVAAAVVFGAVAFATSAQAQCWWNGFNYACAAPVGPVWGGPYWAAPWQTYPTVSGDGYWGFKPQWLPSYPGPRPAGRAGQ